MPAAQWAVARRYSEFFQLHQQLRAKFDSVKQLEFPRRRVVMKLQKDFLEKRRIALDKYLKVIFIQYSPLDPLTSIIVSTSHTRCMSQ